MPDNQPEYEDLYEYFANARVNVEVMFVAPRLGDIIINVRIRPWKNAAYDEMMILAEGLTLDEALVNAYSAIYANQWIPLDWRARIGAPIRTGVQEAKPLVEMPSDELQARIKRLLPPNPTPISQGVKKGPPSVS